MKKYIYLPLLLLALCPVFTSYSSQRATPKLTAEQLIKELDSGGVNPAQLPTSKIFPKVAGSPDDNSMFIALLNAYKRTGILPNVIGIQDESDKGMAPLHWAAANGRIKNIKTLIANRADTEQRDNEQYTPFLRAVLNGQLGAAQELYKRGANTKAVDEAGLSALNIALGSATVYPLQKEQYEKLAGWLRSIGVPLHRVEVHVVRPRANLCTKICSGFVNCLRRCC